MDRAEFLLFRLIAEVPCRTFLDIGSRDAYSALRASEVVPEAGFICFEARRENYERILDDPAVDNEVFRVEHLALSDTTGKKRFYIYDNPAAPDNRGLSSLKARTDLSPSRIDEVEGTTLDAYLSNHLEEPQDLVLWIDVEGAALEVLRGATRSLSVTNLIYVEVEVAPVFEETNSRRDVRRFLAAHGFRELLYRPHGSGEVGDSIFVADDILEAYDIASRVRWWNVQFYLMAPFLEIRKVVFALLTRVPGFLRVWRRIKPLNE